MRENPDCEKYGLRGIWNNMTGEANHRENPIRESLGSCPPPAPAPGELSGSVCATTVPSNQKHQSGKAVCLSGDPQSKAEVAYWRLVWAKDKKRCERVKPWIKVRREELTAEPTAIAQLWLIRHRYRWKSSVKASEKFTFQLGFTAGLGWHHM